MSSSLFYGNLFGRSALVGEFTNGRIVGVQNVNGTFTLVHETTRGPSNIGTGVGQDTSGAALSVTILDALGQPILTNGLANTTVQFGDQFDPEVIATADGGAALAYVTRDGSGDLGIVVEKRDAAGTLVFNSVQVDGFTDEIRPELSQLHDGRLLLSYMIDDGFGNTQLFSRFVLANGALSDRIIVDNHISAFSRLSTDTIADGRVAIAYTDSNGVTGRVALLNDNGFGAQVVTFANGSSAISDVAVTALSDGGFAVTWIEQQAGGPVAYFGRYDDTGGVEQARIALGSPFGDPPVDVDIVGKAAGGFAVQVTSQDAVSGQLSLSVTDYDAAGNFYAGQGSSIGGAALPTLLLTNDDRVISLFNRSSGSDAEYIGAINSNREVVFGTDGADILFADEFGTSQALPIFADGGDDILYTLGVRSSTFDGGGGTDTIDYSFADESIRLLSSGVIHLDNFFDTTDTLVGVGFTPTVERIVGDTADANGVAITDNTIDGWNSSASRFDIDLGAQTLTITLLSAPGNPTLDFEVVNFNKVIGTGNDDTVKGSAGDDSLSGGAGADRLEGGGGDDTLLGGSHGDVLHGNLGDDVIDGGSNFDTVIYTGIFTGVTVNLENGFAIGGGGSDVIANVEHVFGSASNDVIFGTQAHGNRLEGSLGDDTLYGLDGRDTMLGGDGDDRLLGGSDVDVLVGGAGDDTLDGGQGTDFLTGGAGADTFVLQAAGDTGVGRYYRDEYRDFDATQGDVIDLSQADANVYLSGDQDFIFAGTAFTGTGGQIILNDYVLSGVDVTIASFDVHGDGVADGQVYVVGGAVIDDFIL